MTLSLESLLFDSGLYYHILTYFNWNELLNLEQLNKQFFLKIRLSEPLWRSILSKFFATKYYLRPIVKRFLCDGNRCDYRQDLFNMSIKELKYLANYYGLNSKACVEKYEIINLINQRELKNKLPIECLGHYALRIAWLDRKRNCLTEDDLCNYEWNIRVRGDGPLHSLTPTDPWWYSDPSSYIEGQPTTTTLTFYKNGELRLNATGPTFLESILSSQDETNFTYTLEKSGSILSLSFGVKEYVARHPINWGFVLQSQGTVWTNYPMPPKGTDMLLEDENVSSLVSKEINYGPLI